MKRSKTTEAYILCGLAIIAYPFVRLLQAIKRKSKKKNAPIADILSGAKVMGEYAESMRWKNNGA